MQETGEVRYRLDSFVKTWRYRLLILSIAPKLYSAVCGSITVESGLESRAILNVNDGVKHDIFNYVKWVNAHTGALMEDGIAIH